MARKDRSKRDNGNSRGSAGGLSKGVTRSLNVLSTPAAAWSVRPMLQRPVLNPVGRILPSPTFAVSRSSGLPFKQAGKTQLIASQGGTAKRALTGGQRHTVPNPRTDSISPGNASRRGSNLKIAGEPVRDSHQKVRDPLTCKKRPRDNKPRGGDSGRRRFIPWCG